MFVNPILPEPKQATPAMNNTDGGGDCTSDQKAPLTFSEAHNQMVDPSNQAYNRKNYEDKATSSGEFSHFLIRTLV